MDGEARRHGCRAIHHILRFYQIYSELPAGDPLFSPPRQTQRSWISAAERLPVADNFLQKQQEPR
jgi:hypothetical protein